MKPLGYHNKSWTVCDFESFCRWIPLFNRRIPLIPFHRCRRIMSGGGSCRRL